MTDDQAVLSVTSKLTGEFFVGQRVAVCAQGSGLKPWDGDEGVVIKIDTSYKTQNGKPLLTIVFDDDRCTDRFNACWVRPL